VRPRAATRTHAAASHLLVRPAKHDAANENGAWIVSTHPARLFTRDQMMTALTWAASMVVLDASRRGQRVPLLAAWSLAAGIATTVGANLAHGLGHGAVVRSWNRRYEPGTPQATASRR
jgi:hypothetical protein